MEYKKYFFHHIPFLKGIPIFLFVMLFPFNASADDLPGCSYQTYKWNIQQKRAVQRHTVEHPYAELAADEIDANSGCSVCEQDQVWLRLPGIKPFRLCQRYAAQVETALTQLRASGFPIHSVVGYRVGMTRGAPDSAGNRTGFSNHSFGIALDINSQQNGLYDRCITFGPHCRLIRGGTWQPGRPGTLQADGLAVSVMKNLGLRWGGQIVGRQKDFMHFSPSGY